MKTKYGKWFLAEPEEGGGGDAPRGTAVFEDDPIEQEEKKVEGVVDDPPVVEDKKTALIDTDALAKSFGDVLATRFPTTEKKPDEKPLSEEEAKKLLNVWEPTPEWVTKFDNLETRGEALKEQRDGLIKHADTITQFRLREQEKAMNDRYAPVEQFMQSYQQEQATKRFHTTYPVLADPKLEPLIDAVATNLKKQGKTYTDEDVLFKDLAEGVEAVIKVSNPDFKLSTTGSNPAEKTKTKGSSPNGIPVTTLGAGGGTVAKGQSVVKKRGLAIFD